MRQQLLDRLLALADDDDIGALIQIFLGVAGRVRAADDDPVTLSLAECERANNVG